MIYWELFLIYLQIGAFSFGGGYAAMPLIQSLVVQQNGWLTMAEYADLTTIAEMTPGPIAVNSATFVGQKMAGLPGALVCTLGCVLPSLIIVLLLAWLYTKYREMTVVKNVLGQLRPAVVAMIAGAGLTIILFAFFGTSTLKDISFASIHWVEIGLYIAAMILIRKFKWGPIQIIFSTALVGTLIYMFL